jgi:hypothetical protein
MDYFVAQNLFKLSALKYPVYLCLLLTFFFFRVNGQEKCITTQKMDEVFNNDPEARARFENTQKMLDQKVKNYLSDDARLFRTTSIINIPVVVHVMLGTPAQVTDAIVQRQIDTLNKYYGGAPAGDSLRVYTPFRTTYGRSQIRFCLAQRTPSNTATTGITRTSSSYNPNGSGHPSSVVPAWNTTKYLNIWVVNFGTSGTLGYSYLPGTFPPGDQRAGLVVDYRCFGSNANYLFSEYNMGKTALHEIGHYFNLGHPWGNGSDSNPTCSQDDGCTDTPKTSEPSYGCTSNPPVTNACSPNAPGVMWQNIMDYGDDRCMLLFTAQQCARMETALNNSPDRNPILTSQGCQPPVLAQNDASISAILDPTSGGYVCTNTVLPRITLKNAGSNLLTSASILVNLNGSPLAPFSWTGSLATNASVNINLPAININNGLNNLIITSSLPNGVTDGNMANDSRSTTFNFSTAINLPLVEGFESSLFPPQNWQVNNPDNDFTWMRGSPGKLSSGSLFINNYDDDAANNKDDFRSRPITIGNTAGLLIDFDVAHKFYPADGFHDTLSVLISDDCGTTFQTVYKKWGTLLATAGADQNSYLLPQLSDWRSEKITITSSAFSSGSVVIIFRNTSKFGNNIFIDNINIYSPIARDLVLTEIPSPAELLCTNSFIPSVKVRNQSADLITSYKIGYQIDNGPLVMQTFNQPLNPFTEVSHTLASASVNTGNRSIRIFTADPVSIGGTGDANNSNDTLVKSFVVAGNVSAPVSESFVTAGFPPSNWAIFNPDQLTTWSRFANGRGNAGAAYIKNFGYTSRGQSDMLLMPQVRYNNADSIFLSFDLAASSFRPAGLSMDTLEILVTSDCGNNYTSVYKKWGSQLRTITPAQTNEFFPSTMAQWRRETIDLTAFIDRKNLLVMFRSVNQQENNIFLDNINFSTVSLPALLKQRGYQIYPNIFRSSFTLWFYRQPETLQYINIYNSVGQLVWSKQFNNNAELTMQIDLGSKPSGVYIVKMGYSDKNDIIEKVIKY